MGIGLLYTPVSIYQMTRGALVLFVGIFSVIFLRRRLWLYQFVFGIMFRPPWFMSHRWVSLLTVMAGVCLVGYSGSLIKDAVKEAVNLVTSGRTAAEPIDEPDMTRVLVGSSFSYMVLSHGRAHPSLEQAYSLSFLRRYCEWGIPITMNVLSAVVLVRRRNSWSKRRSWNAGRSPRWSQSAAKDYSER